MRVGIRTLLISVVLCFAVSGCGLVGLSQSPNKTDDWEVFDPNDYGITKVDDGNGGVNYTWKYKADIVEDDNSINYWKSKHAFRGYPVVKGELNGKIYPMIFDTGCSPTFFIQDIHVSENDLPVFFFNQEKKRAGLAIAKTISSGSMRFENQPCVFFGQSPRYTLLGVPFAREKDFAVGLPTIRGFKYCKFDQVGKRIQFSSESVFAPEDSEYWISYPFELKGHHLLLNIQVEGVDTALMLDTGACIELELFDTVTEKLYEKRADYKKAWKFKTRLFTPHMNRKVEALKFKAKDLTLGEHVLDEVKVYSRPVKKGAEYDGVIGMKLFKKTAMVLDFDKNLMWVRKSKGSLFD